jgi:Zn-dependent M28 family amino/carboxypeptidase
MNRTGGTDHQSFDNVGLPGFQFIQDALDYETRTHHSNMDLYERLDKDDLMQASVIMAAFAYNAAMRDAMLPRKPLPTEETAAQSEWAAPATTPKRGSPTPGPSPTPTPGPH